MALIKCPECGKEVSDRAQVCIHCGFPLQESIVNSRFYSVVMTGKPPQVSSFSARLKLIEIGEMTVREADYVANTPGEVVLSHLPHEVAESHVSALTAAGAPVSVVEEPQESVDSEESIGMFPTVYIKSMKFHKKDRPFLECGWKDEFPPLSSIFQNVVLKGIRSSWARNDAEGEENKSEYAFVTLFTSRREKLGTFPINQIDTVKGGSSFVWLDQNAINKAEHGNASICTLGNVESVPTDEMSRKGTVSVPAHQSADSLVVACPKCGSTSIQVLKQGFGAGKAVAGALLLGPIGLAAGAIGSNNISRVCAKCGHRF